MFPLKPLADRLFVKIDESEAVSPGGILMPGSSSKFRKATVVAAGRGAVQNGHITPLEVSVGDTVWISPGGDEMTVGDQKYTLIFERQIVASLKGDHTNAKSAKKVISE